MFEIMTGEYINTEYITHIEKGDILGKGNTLYIRFVNYNEDYCDIYEYENEEARNDVLDRLLRKIFDNKRRKQ